MAYFSTKTNKHVYWQSVVKNDIIIRTMTYYVLGDVPLSMLKVQGSSSLFVTSGQLALCFHVLANVTAVPSINPLVVLKSSASTSLKSPQRPG